MSHDGRKQLPQILVLAIAVALTISIPPRVFAATWNVYENGTGDAPTIQAAFDSTANGDTIAIHCGDYAGAKLTIFLDSRNVRFIGQGGDPSCVRIRFDIAMYSDVTYFENLTFAYGSSMLIDFDEIPGEGAVGKFQDCVFDSSNVGMASSASFTDCVFQNGVRNEGGSVAGYYDGKATFNQCVFRDNDAEYGGGAVYAWLYDMTFNDCRFENNSSSDRGGAVFVETSASVTFERCEFEGNVAGTDGGAVSARRGRVRLIECLLKNNAADWHGGAVAIDTSQANSLAFSILWNCTLWGNQTDSLGGGVYYDGWASPQGGFAIINTIISGTAQGEAIHVADLAPKVFCTDIWGNPDGDWTGPLADSLSVNNNFSLNPKFCDAALGNFDLKPASPCLDVVGCTYGTLVGYSGAECTAQATDVAGAGDADGAQDDSFVGGAAFLATPNPFRGDVTLRFASPAASATELLVFDLRGRKVARTPVLAGARTATWDARPRRRTHRNMGRPRREWPQRVARHLLPAVVRRNAITDCKDHASTVELRDTRSSTFALVQLPFPSRYQRDCGSESVRASVPRSLSPIGGPGVRQTGLAHHVSRPDRAKARRSRRRAKARRSRRRAPTTRPNHAHNPKEIALRPEDFILAYEAALATQDWSKVAPLIHEDACVTFSNGSVHRGKSEVRAAFEKNFAAIKSESYHVENVDWIRKGEELAVYRFDFAWSGYIGGKLASGAGRGTSVLTLEAGSWQLLVEHLGPGPA